MNVLVWVVSAVLAAAFLGAGLLKASQPKDKLRERMAWVDDFAPRGIKGIGAAEALGAVGLILPWALDIVPVLTPLAASGLFLTMVGAVLVHVRRGERKEIAPPAVLGLLSLFVAVARFAQL